MCFHLPAKPQRKRIAGETDDLEAREHVSLNTLASALKLLTGIETMNDVSSPLEMLEDKEVTFMRAKVLRCQGRFEESYAILAALQTRDTCIAL